jgi:hypothetical protein
MAGFSAPGYNRSKPFCPKWQFEIEQLTRRVVDVHFVERMVGGVATRAGQSRDDSSRAVAEKAKWRFWGSLVPLKLALASLSGRNGRSLDNH